MSLLVGRSAPKFRGTAVIGGDASALNAENGFKDISLGD